MSSFRLTVEICAGRKVYASELNPTVKGIVTNGKLGIYGGGMPIITKDALIERIREKAVFSQARSVADYLKKFNEAEGLKQLVEIARELYGGNLARMNTFKFYLADISELDCYEQRVIRALPDSPDLETAYKAEQIITVIDRLIDELRGNK